MARVEAEFRTHHACQEEQAVHSQFQDEQLQDRILKIEEARANDHANYKVEIRHYKEERQEALREQQGRHEAEMETLHEAMLELKA